MNPDLEQRVGELLQRSQKIEAIKLVVEHTGWGLKQAKDYVDGLEQPKPSLTDLEIETRVRELVRQKKAIEAIKFVREATGAGLKQAKDYVDFFLKQ